MNPTIKFIFVGALQVLKLEDFGSFELSPMNQTNPTMVTDAGLPRSEKKWKIKSFPGQGIAFSVREI